MLNTRYYVVGDHDAWLVECGVAEAAQSMSRHKAMVAFATFAAQALSMPGEHPHVCVLDDNGRLRPVWRGNDNRATRVGKLRLDRDR
jgi:hypothetical protein